MIYFISFKLGCPHPPRYFVNSYFYFSFLFKYYIKLINIYWDLFDWTIEFFWIEFNLISIINLLNYLIFFIRVNNCKTIYYNGLPFLLWSVMSLVIVSLSMPKFCLIDTYQEDQLCISDFGIYPNFYLNILSVILWFSS